MSLFAGENRVVANDDVHVEVAGRAAIAPRTALTRLAETVAGVDTRWDAYLQRLGEVATTLPVAVVTRLLDDAAATTALWAGLLHHERALAHAHLSLTTAAFALHRLVALGRARTATGFAFAGNFDAELGGMTEHRLL